MSKVKSIAVTGKGGTGKTVLATLLIHMLAADGQRVLAIDADSAMSLPYTLGIEVDSTVSQVRKDLLGKNHAEAQLKLQTGGPTKTVMKEILAHGDGFDLLAMGRPEEPGCFCAVNELLRYGIDSLADEYDYVIIDGEAGPEQLNRRVMKQIDLLFVVADMSARSLETAAGIIKVASSYGEEEHVRKAGLVLNRVRDDEVEQDRLDKIGVDVLGAIPEDPVLNSYDREGRSLDELPDDAGAVVAVGKVLDKIEQIEL